MAKQAQELDATSQEVSEATSQENYEIFVQDLAPPLRSSLEKTNKDEAIAQHKSRFSKQS